MSLIITLNVDKFSEVPLIVSTVIGNHLEFCAKLIMNWLQGALSSVIQESDNSCFTLFVWNLTYLPKPEFITPVQVESFDPFWELVSVRS